MPALRSSRCLNHASDASPWQPGLSTTSAGRFAGYRGVRQPGNGFLCWSAERQRLILHDTDDQHGSILFELLALDGGAAGRSTASLGLREHVDWTTQRFDLLDLNQTDANRQLLGQLTHTLLFPGMLLDWRRDAFAWWNPNFAGSSLLYPTAAGPRLITTAECHPPTFDATGGHAFAQPWMLLWTHQGGIPLLFVFENPPIGVETVSRWQKLMFKGPAGRVAVCPFAGCDRFDSARVRALAQGLRDEDQARIDQWVRLALAAPVACEEQIRVDQTDDRIHVVQRLRHLSRDDRFGAKPLKLAPLPPLLAGAYAAQQRGHDLGLRIEGEVVDTGIPTLFGPYVGVEGDQIRFSIPRSAGMTHTIAPVHVTDDDRCEPLKRRLDAELAQPTLTFGGDNTYDPDDIQDILHNLRVLGWSTWAIDPGSEGADTRAKRFANLARGLRGFEPSQYTQEIEPVSGLKYCWEKTIWGGGAIPIDLEWYNGMQLAGLWCGVYFAPDDATRAALLRIIKNQWSLARDLLRYFEIFHDWATGLTFTALTRKCLWFDGLNFAWHGQAGAARLARLLGDDQTADRAEYLAARSSIGRAASWFMLDYAIDHQAVPAVPTRAHAGTCQAPLSDPRAQLIVGGFLERRGMVLCSRFGAGDAIGYLVPEQFLMHLTHPDVLDQLRRGQYEGIDVDVPDWATLHNRGPDGSPGKHKHRLYAEHTHFYHLDPQLFVRSLLLREPLEKLLNYTADLSGPVMTCLLTAAAPQVLVPTEATFRGVTWDAGTHTLTLDLTASTSGCEVLVRDVDAPHQVCGADGWSHDGPCRLLRLPFSTGVGRVQVTWHAG